jgi:hypothetical protein
VWGPLVSVVNLGGVDFANVGGCVAVLSPDNEACGEAIQAQFHCQVAACSACNVSDDGGSAAQLDALSACFDAASQGACASLASAAASCAQAVDPAVLSECSAGTTDLDQVFVVMDAMCGSDLVPTGLEDASVPEDGGHSSPGAGADASPPHDAEADASPDASG